MFLKTRGFQRQRSSAVERPVSEMAETAAKKMRPLNFVHNDEIWKDHIRHENVSARHKWPETWGHLIYEYRKMNRVLAGSPVASGPPSPGPPGQLKLPPIPTAPERPQGFPMTTSQLIGWRSANPDCVLEKYGLYTGPFAKGKCTLIRRLKWPHNFAC